ncbi:MAG TPA: TetR/AcrR family transcriptional regulator [Xanthomonadales bacterium]|nr:TetR/AcrR family transcriptional regulator [Xanthomonadales bacterium]
MKPKPIKTTEKKPRRGRPSDSKKGDFRQQILDSAEQAFAHSSFDSVSLKDIASPVGVTPAMIHYYFGSKQVLLQSVVEQALEPVATAIQSQKLQQDANIEEFVAQLYATMQRHPNLPLLFFRQVLLPGGPMQEHFLQQLAPRLGGALPGLISRGQEAGRIAKELDPSIAALMVLSLCIFPLVSRPLSEPALGMKFDTDGMTALQQHVIRFIQRGLQTP